MVVTDAFGVNIVDHIVPDHRNGQIWVLHLSQFSAEGQGFESRSSLLWG